MTGISRLYNLKANQAGLISNKTKTVFFMSVIFMLFTVSGFGWVNPGFETGLIGPWTTQTNVGTKMIQLPRVTVVNNTAPAPHTVGTLNSAGLSRVHSGTYAVELFSGRGDTVGHEDWAQVKQTDTVPTNGNYRSEERRVGKECRSRW